MSRTTYHTLFTACQRYADLAVIPRSFLNDPNLPSRSDTHDISMAFILSAFYMSCVGDLVPCMSPQIVIRFWEVAEMLRGEGKLEVTGQGLQWGVYTSECDTWSLVSSLVSASWLL